MLHSPGLHVKKQLDSGLADAPAAQLCAHYGNITLC